MKPQLPRIELHTAVFLFGTAGLFGKLVAVDAMTIVFARTAFAAAALILALRLFRLPLELPTGRSRLLMPASGLVLALHWYTFFHAIQVSSVAIGLLGYASFPIFVTFLEPLVSRQKIRAVDVASAVLVVIGLILVAPSFRLSDAGTLGLAWAVLSGALFAVLTLLNRNLVTKHSYRTIALFQYTAAALVMLPFVLPSSEWPGWKTTGLLLVLGVLCTALPHLLFIKSLRSLTAQFVSIVSSLEPVYGIVLAALFLDEIPTGSTIIGAVFIFCAVWFAARVQPGQDVSDGPA